jgi:hypothetical protein
MYKQLMEQHGGSVPFSVIGGTKKKEPKQTKRKRGKKKQKTKQRLKKGSLSSQKPSRSRHNRAMKYSPGTILRRKDGLYQLNENNKWFKL